MSVFTICQEVIVWPEELKSEHDSQSLLKEKYQKFNEEVTAQEPRVNEVLKLADLLIDGGHPEDIVIRRRKEVKISTSVKRLSKVESSYFYKSKIYLGTEAILAANAEAGIETSNVRE